MLIISYRQLLYSDVIKRHVLKYVAHLQAAGVVVHLRVFPGFVSFLVCGFLFFFAIPVLAN